MTMTTPNTTSNIYIDIDAMLAGLRKLCGQAIAADDRERIAEVRSLLAMWLDNLRPCAECGLVIECDRHEQSVCTLRPGDDRDVVAPAYY